MKTLFYVVFSFFCCLCTIQFYAQPTTTNPTRVAGMNTLVGKSFKQHYNTTPTHVWQIGIHGGILRGNAINPWTNTNMAQQVNESIYGNEAIFFDLLEQFGGEFTAVNTTQQHQPKPQNATIYGINLGITFRQNWRADIWFSQSRQTLQAPLPIQVMPFGSSQLPYTTMGKIRAEMTLHEIQSSFMWLVKNRYIQPHIGVIAALQRTAIGSTQAHIARTDLHILPPLPTHVAPGVGGVAGVQIPVAKPMSIALQCRYIKYLPNQTQFSTSGLQGLLSAHYHFGVGGRH